MEISASVGFTVKIFVAMHVSYERKILQFRFVNHDTWPRVSSCFWMTFRGRLNDFKGHHTVTKLI